MRIEPSPYGFFIVIRPEVMLLGSFHSCSRKLFVSKTAWPCTVNCFRPRVWSASSMPVMIKAAPEKRRPGCTPSWRRLARSSLL